MSSKRIMDIELLRAVAVIGVLFHHLQGMPFPADGRAWRPWPTVSSCGGAWTCSSRFPGSSSDAA